MESGATRSIERGSFVVGEGPQQDNPTNKKFVAVETEGHIVSLDPSKPTLPSKPFFPWLARLVSSSSERTTSTWSTSTASSSKTQEDLRSEKSLLSSADFATVAGKSFWGHGATYRSVKNALQDYEHATAEGSLSTAEQIKLLQDVQKKTQVYLDKKNGDFVAGDKTTSLQDRRNAAQFLMNGIRTELERLTNKLAEESFGTTTTISFRQEDEMATVSLSGGAMNTSIDKVFYHDKARTVAIFKPVDAETLVASTPATRMGIPQKSTLAANLAGRSVASYSVSRLLGWTIVPRTGFATHAGQVGSCQVVAKGESLFEEKWFPMTMSNILENESTQTLFESCIDDGILDDALHSFNFDLSCNMPLVKGQDGKIYEKGTPITQKRAYLLLEKGFIILSKKETVAVSSVDFSNPHLQKTLSRAHLFDLLTGQLDRNPGNFIYRRISEAPEQWEAALIDNDLSFPEQFQSFDLSDASLDFVCSTSDIPIARLPHLIDREAAEAITALDPEKLQETLQQEGKLTADEINATLSRLALLKEHIASASASGPVRLIDTWNQETFEELMTPGKDERYDNHVGLQHSLRQRKLDKLTALTSE